MQDSKDPAEGMHTCSYKTGHIYRGILHRGKREGLGTMYFPDGTKYTGQWLAGRRHGKGHETLPNGSTYEGCWEDDSRSGEGVYVQGFPPHYNVKAPPPVDTYTGQWARGEIDGEGSFHYACGDRYEGQWERGALCGRGTYTYADGAAYEGEFSAWKGGVRQGEGVYLFASDGRRYVGSWDRGLHAGHGAMHFAQLAEAVPVIVDGRATTPAPKAGAPDSAIWEGSWRYGRPAAAGTLSFLKQGDKLAQRAPAQEAMTVQEAAGMGSDAMAQSKQMRDVAYANPPPQWADALKAMAHAAAAKKGKAAAAEALANDSPAKRAARAQLVYAGRRPVLPAFTPLTKPATEEEEQGARAATKSQSALVVADLAATRRREAFKKYLVAAGKKHALKRDAHARKAEGKKAASAAALTAGC